MSKGIEETLKQLIQIRVFGALAEIDSEPTPKELRAIMEVATEAVYGPVMDLIKELGAEVGVELQNANAALLLPDTANKEIIK